MRERKRLWTLLYKRDGRDKVWIYEKLRKKRNYELRKAWVEKG